MKKISLLIAGIAMIVLTNNDGFAQAKKKVVKTTTTTKTTLSKADIEQGKNLLSKSDCLACHQVQARVVGPAYTAVAAKYPATDANISKLADKIIKGGAGVWGQVPMTPHPSISNDDAKLMVKYILSLKSK